MERAIIISFMQGVTSLQPFRACSQMRRSVFSMGSASRLQRSCSGVTSTRPFIDWPSLMTNLPTGLCHRRQWPEPYYQPYTSRAGVKCVVRVNNREYHTDTTYESDLLAKENAAMRAYLICRNFSVNDGMYPSGHKKGGVLQGMPVAIGTERRSTVYHEEPDSSVSSGSRSGGSSPSSYDSSNSYRGSQIYGSTHTYTGTQTYRSTPIHGGERRSGVTGRVLVYGGSRRR